MNQQLPPAYQQQQAGVVQQNVPLHTMQPTGTTVVTTENQSRPGNWKGMKTTGTIQLILGFFTVILGVVGIVVGTSLSEIGSPVWCGILFYSVNGLLGVLAGQNQNVCAATAYMIISIFTCLSAVVVASFSGGAIAMDRFCMFYDNDCNPISRRTVSTILVIVAVTEFIVSIVGACMTCGAVCCYGNSHAQTVVHYQAQPQVVTTVPAAAPPQVYQAAAQIPAYPQQQTSGTPQGLFQPPPPVYAPADSANIQPHVQNLYSNTVSK